MEQMEQPAQPVPLVLPVLPVPLALPALLAHKAQQEQQVLKGQSD
jgi:hypothetical protein